LASSFPAEASSVVLVELLLLLQALKNNKNVIETSITIFLKWTAIVLSS
jgi:hypothetical protein